MNVNRAGKQQQAYWRSEAKCQKLWESEKPVTDSQKAYGQYFRICERVQGFAAGWLAGVAWARRSRKEKKV